MAATVGKNGGFYVGATLVPFIDSWNIDMTIGSEETTAFGDDNVKRVATIRDWSGSASGTLDRSDASQAALLDQFEDGTISPTSVRLATNRGSDYWEGSAIISGASIGSAVGSKVTVSFSLTAADALSWTEA